jgi:hypothetical protein
MQCRKQSNPITSRATPVSIENLISNTFSFLKEMRSMNGGDTAKQILIGGSVMDSDWWKCNGF